MDQQTLDSVFDGLGRLVSTEQWDSVDSMVQAAQVTSSGAYQFLRAMANLRRNKRSKTDVDYALDVYNTNA